MSLRTGKTKQQKARQEEWLEQLILNDLFCRGAQLKPDLVKLYVDQQGRSRLMVNRVINRLSRDGLISLRPADPKVEIEQRVPGPRLEITAAGYLRWQTQPPIVN